MPILRYFTFCVHRSRTSSGKNNIKLFNDNSQLDIFYTDDIPQSIKELLVYIAREGVAVVDLFRRPGNTQQIKQVIHLIKLGETIDWSKYNFYTLANIAKRYLLQIDKGILGIEVEKNLIATLELPDDQTRLECMTTTLSVLSPNVKQLLALLFGTWFRMIYHTEVNEMSVEAVAKSVAGSIFPSCTINPEQVNKASKVMEYLITGFASSELFGKELIEYFTNETQTSISRTEKYKYEFIYPKNVSKKKSTRLFVRMLLEESSKHGFDLLKDEVTEEEFNAVDNCVHSHDVLDDVPDSLAHLTNGIECDIKTRKRRLSKTMTYPYFKSMLSHSDQVQQTSEKRTCVTASSTYLGLTATSSIHNFDVSPDGAYTSETSSGQDDERSSSYNSTSPAIINRKTARLDISDDSKMDEMIKSELRKREMENDLTYITQSLPQNGGRFSRVKIQQLKRLQKRSNWFLSSPSGCKTETLMQLNPTANTPLSIISDGRPMSAEIHTSSSQNNGRYSDYSTNQTKGSESRTNITDVNDWKSLPTQIVLSNPMVFDSVSGDHIQSNHDNSLIGIEYNEASLLAEEIEVRYFIVQKYYGPGSVRSED